MARRKPSRLTTRRLKLLRLFSTLLASFTLESGGSTKRHLTLPSWHPKLNLNFPENWAFYVPRCSSRTHPHCHRSHRSAPKAPARNGQFVAKRQQLRGTETRTRNSRTLALHSCCDFHRRLGSESLSRHQLSQSSKWLNLSTLRISPFKKATGHLRPTAFRSSEGYCRIEGNTCVCLSELR